jgi:8-oxo-dGTP diphosphatase
MSGLHDRLNANLSRMKRIAMVLLFDRHRRLLVYLRDDKPDIPFPNHWDFFGGHVEAGETPEEALVREVKEEIVDLKQWAF